MADTTEQDPSIEEILASIRQIISDDDAEAESTEAPEEDVSEPVVEPEPVEEVEESAPTEEDEPEEDIFELTKDMQEDESNAEDAFDVSFPEDDTDDTSKEELFTNIAASATVGAFTKLSENVALANFSENVTLEEIVKDMLRPMLREWIDSNMPRLVEVLVEKELEKLARQARDS